MKSFTLIETLVTISIFTLIFGALAAFIVTAYKFHGFTFQQSLAIAEARKGIETMVKEIREVTSGADGSYPIEKADDKEFIFYSDIDRDGEVERVRYFLGTERSGSQTKECVSFEKGNTCSVSFANFLEGSLESAQLTVSTEGDLGWSKEYVEIFVDGNQQGRICQTGCSDCAASWEGTKTFIITDLAKDNFLSILADASGYVDPFCDWVDPNHSFKAKFELKWSETSAVGRNELRKGVIDPAGFPPRYPLDQEKVTVISSYVRNDPPIFRYFDENGNEILDLPARLTETKLMQVYLVINVNPHRPPPDFELISAVQLRNLKME